MNGALAALVVDDDELVRIAVSKQLKSMGANLIENADDGPSARRALGRGSRFDLIVCDLMLPGIDGVEFLREIVRVQPHAALILISSLDERIVRSVAVLGRERGLRVLGALRKPVRAEALRQLLESFAVGSPERPAQARLGLVDVMRGIESQAIGALVQPKLLAANRQLHSAELLLRWEDRRLGTVPPLELLRAAEKFGVSHTLAEYTLQLALRIGANWVRAGLAAPISVNLSAPAMRRLDLPDRIDGLLRAAELEPGQLTIEVSESTLSDEPELLDVLTRLRMRGVRVALDHYGSGYASLVRLQRLPINEVKIDRSFVRCVGAGQVATTIVEYSIKMAKALGLETVAVGVETAEQAQLLTALGCEVLQGNYIGEPIPPEQLIQWKDGPPPMATKPSTANDAPQPQVQEAVAA